MKNKLLVSNLRKIGSSYKRFLSLFFLSLLGVGFFVGIKSAAPDMKITLDKYLDSVNYYDIEVISSLGMTYEDIIKIKELDNISEIEGVKSFDFVYNSNDIEKNVRVTSLGNINKVILLDGSLPLNNDEIVVDKKFFNDAKLTLNDYIYIDNSTLRSKNLKVVGVIESPLFFAHEYMGTTSVGNGELHYVSYVLENAFNTNYYTSVNLTVSDAFDLLCTDEEYVNLIDFVSYKINGIKKEQEDIRFNSLFGSKIDQMNSLGVAVDYDEFPKSIWYINDRDDNLSYSTFITMVESIEKLGNVFPLLFYVVAILISLISMARMVEEDRVEIGTLKGLGFSNSSITFRYIMYSLSATVAGGIFGMIIGSNFFPRILWGIYESIFLIKTFSCEFILENAIIGLVISIVCICGAAVINVRKLLKEKPSELMRPKAPKAGKKILLERIHLVWNKLSFSNKISTRNIFRYKKRIFATIIGIASSTALIVVALGIRDSINDISKLNYEHVHLYDNIIGISDDNNLEEIYTFLDYNQSIIYNVRANYETIDIYNGDERIEINLVSPYDKDELKNVITLRDVNNKYNVIDIVSGKIVLSEKLAKLLDVSIGDKVGFLVSDEYKEIKVSHIVENYIGNYAYVDRETYTNIFGDYDGNVIFLKVSYPLGDEYTSKLVDLDGVASVTDKQTMLNQTEEIISSLDSVILVLVLSSAILAFTILYNLSTINISERKREISTLKVLGFYDEEVDAYITKENYFITLIGILIGNFAGYKLCFYIVELTEPFDLMFAKNIKLLSYLIATFMSLLFTIIVNRITHYSLKNVDMLESLKSNE